MHNKGELDRTTYLYLRDRAELRTPQYMLPKIHKPDHPGRPILSGNDGPTERISKYLDYFLRPIAHLVNSYYVRDTGNFLNHIRDLPPLLRDCILVSMDVKSLYTQIPQHEAITAVLRALKEADTTQHYAIRMPSPRRFVHVQMLQLILKENTFSFGDHFHRRQTRGCAMDSTVSPSLAIIFMAHLEHFYDLDTRNVLFSTNSGHDSIKVEAKWHLHEVPHLDTVIYKGPNFERHRSPFVHG